MSLLWCECRSFTCNLYLQSQSVCVWIHYYRCTFPQSYMRIGPVVFPSSCWQSEQSLFFFLLQNKYSSCVNGRQNQLNNPSTPQGAPKWNKQTKGHLLNVTPWSSWIHMCVVSIFALRRRKGVTLSSGNEAPGFLVLNAGRQFTGYFYQSWIWSDEQ